MIENLIQTISQNGVARDMIGNIFKIIGGDEYRICRTSNVIAGAEYIDYLVMKDGAKYKSTTQSNITVEQTRRDYDLSVIKPDDVVLDIGANVGGYTIAAALKCKHVYAVEPLFTDLLKENILLNDLTNVTIIRMGIGGGESQSIKYADRSDDMVLSVTLTKLLNILPLQPTILKSDCEGGEQYFVSKDFDGFRHIEMEMHPKDFISNDNVAEYIYYLNDGWTITTNHKNRNTNYLLKATR